MNANLYLRPPLTNLLFPIQIRHYKRRRLKLTTRNVTLCCSTNNHLLDPFHNFLFQNSFDFLAPVLGLTSGLTLFLTQFKPYNSLSKPKTSDIGEWIFFTIPTPFNRFVLLRCPSISFEGSELLEDVNEKLVEEDRHFVRLNSGRIQAKSRWKEEEDNEKLQYQRLCLSTEDGGVISFDWPANLDLDEEHGLDTTVLLVPGTANGSMDESVRSFVVEALKCGFFPVVMNPRGCAGSPLTTARLFTAADSDDICTAIQFINKARPWTTLMAVGWGYGANMLTKYLAEVGERTPLTAATCINNPFDLEEATRCFPYHIALDQKLTGGLIDILQSNKELFQGKAKGFDMEKALLAKSVRDFEKAISMVSYGFREIEDFYSESSTRGVIGNVKIPVLFIQNDDGTVPLFSIPRGLIAENPFTSLLLCSCVQSSVSASGQAAVSWCQSLTIEWLSAVELGLLKGRHPLLKDVDVNINPSKSLALVEGRVSDKGVEPNKFLGVTLNDANGYTIEPLKEMPEDNNTAVRLQSRSRQDTRRSLELEEGLQEEENGALQQTSSIDAELIKEEATDPIDAEIGQVLQTTQVVMNMLDLTMPGMLSDEKKKKVLAAVGQGETVMKALQDVVPEDVREKLTTAVSAILRAQHTNLKFDGLLGIGKISDVSSGPESKVLEKVQEVSTAEGMPKDPHSSDQMRRGDDLADGSGNNQSGSDKSSTGLEPELYPSKNIQKSVDSSQSQAMSSQQGDTSGSVRKDTSDLGNNHERDEVIKEKGASYSTSGAKGLEASANPNFTNCTEKAGCAEEAIVDRSKVEKDGGIPQLDTKRENNTQKNEVKTHDSSADQNKMVSTNISEETHSCVGSSLDALSMEREGSDDQMRENKMVQPSLDQNKPAISDFTPHTFSVAQALDALTGMDDSTQVAVNSVFGVIEDMITQLEEEKDDENKSEDTNEVENKSEDTYEVEDESNDSASREKHTTEVGMLSDTSEDVDKHRVNIINPQNAVSTGWIEEELAENPILFSVDDTNGSSGNSDSNFENKEAEKINQLIDSEVLADYTPSSINNIPMHITTNPYGHHIANEYFHRYLLSKMPHMKPLDLDTTTSLLLDYFPEEGQWKLLEQPETIGESIGDVTTHDVVNRKAQVHSPAKVTDPDNYIEPSYVVLDSEKQQEPVGEYNMMDNLNENVENGDDKSQELMQFVKVIILDALRVEVGRKLGTTNMKKMKPNLARDLEQVADAASLAVGCAKDHTWCFQGKDYMSDCISEKVGTLHGEHIIRAISSAVLDTSYLRRLMPIGVMIGASLAALRKYFNVATMPDTSLKFPDQNKNPQEKIQSNVGIKDVDKMPSIKIDNSSFNSMRRKGWADAALKNIKNDSVMVGAVTAALGASALLVQQQETGEISDKSSKESGNYQKVPEKVDEEQSEKDQNNIVTSLAEKAMSVAGPVVPTKEDGELDQERLVAMLADLGQRGGVLRLVGKIALLWGGIRGAMSLTDRLILFLRIAERPLYQRVLGFVGMVLVLWSPVVVPLLPMLVQSWTASNPSRFAVLVCIIGLYTAVMILVMLWGRRIRGYEDPVEQYGLDLASPPKIQSFLKALIGGVVLVLSMQSINALLGCVSFSWPSGLPSSSLDVLSHLKLFGQLILLLIRGIITATCVVLVEELLFRSWLTEEVAADLGYHQGIILSGLAFSLSQRSPLAIPGLWLFSLALAGFRERSQGSLSIPIGLRTGIMASSFVLQTGGFLIHTPNFPSWVIGTHPLQPFSGAIGFSFSLLLAIILYPRQPLQKKLKLERTTGG